MPAQHNGGSCTYLGRKVANDRLYTAQDITPLDPTPGLALVAVHPFGPDKRPRPRQASPERRYGE